MHLEAFRRLMAEEKIDGFLITQPENRRYLSGFTGSNGVLIITQDKQVIATDSRYYEQVRLECPPWELARVGYDFAGNMLELLRSLELGARRVGFEAGHVTVATLHAWERALLGRLVLVHTEGLVENLRMVKTGPELDRIRKAITLADEAFVHVTGWLEPSMTEQQVAWELESYMRLHGAEAISFPTIVASGPNSAKSHARPTDRRIQAGEPLILDFGCVVDGYCSDITRTICLGEPADDRYLSLWRLIFRAQQAALKGAKAGMTGDEVDKLARDIIVEAGFGDNFGHSLGHGIGLAVHELPRYSYAYPHQVYTGTVMTIEPGVYFPDWGGVRLEDVVLVGEDGVEILTTAPQQPILNGGQLKSLT